MVFALGERRFAVPVTRVLDVANVTAYTPLPCEDPTNLGVVLHRERLTPLVDLAPRLGVGRTHPLESPGLCLFVRTGRGEMGFPIDQVTGVAPVAGARLPEGFTVLDPDGWGGFHAQGAAG